MRRGLVHALAWCLATGAAVTLSWWGVHTVLSGTVYDPPRALPLPAGGTADRVSAGSDPLTSSTRRPGTTGPSAPVTTKPTPSDAGTTPAAPTATPSRTAKPTTEAPPATTPATGGTTADDSNDSNVKTYTVDGGRVTFDLGETSAELVSATPAAGWQMQVWKQPSWIRVTFTADGRELSVFCVWHDTAPRVEIEDRAT
ncbi:hypothetical protein AB0A76_29195 [Streptomyces exfoliatus]|uniref:Secreted protein n=1 Tax=Streptomyces exfoliatus TaxID=1905 RepID=A0ABV3D408_STREX